MDYFPHPTTDEDLNDVLRILENEYGNDGYAFYFKLLERLATSDGHYYEYGEVMKRKLLATKIGIPEEKCDELLNLLSEIRIIDQDLFERKKVIWCQSFVDDIADVYKTRSTPLPTRPDYFLKENEGFLLENASFLPDNPQSKVNKIKEKESKNNTENTFIFSLMNNTDYLLPEEYLENWIFKYPNIDVKASLGNFSRFLIKLGSDNHITRENIIRAIENWLNNETERKGKAKKKESNIYIPPNLKVIGNG